jgi:hypothetical protein
MYDAVAMVLSATFPPLSEDDRLAVLEFLKCL